MERLGSDKWWKPCQPSTSNDRSHVQNDSALPGLHVKKSPLFHNILRYIHATMKEDHI